MRYRVLGPVEVRGTDGWTQLRGQQAMLLSQLVAAYPRPAGFGTLGQAFWGDRPPSRPDAAMKVAVARLRKTLGQDLIDYTPAGYVLVDEIEVVDRTVFLARSRDAAEAAEQGRFSDALFFASEALDCWRGEPFASVSDPLSLAPEIQRLNDEQLRVRELVVDVLLAVGSFDLAASEASRNTTDESFRERWWEQLMLALHLGGRSVEASRIFHQYRTRLDREVGLEPGDSIRRLDIALVSGEPVVDWFRFRRDRAIAHAEGDGEETMVVDRGHPGDELRPESAPPHRGSIYIDRPDAMAELSAAVADANLVTIVGAPGVGKTRLALQWVAGTDTRAVAWTDLAFETGNSVAGAIADAVGIAGFDGELDVALAQRVHAGLRYLVLDSCEHVVTETADAVARIHAAQPDLCVVVTSREPIAGARVVRLGPLGHDEAARLLTARSGGVAVLRPEDLDVVVQACDGLPLALEIAASRLQREPVDAVADDLRLGDVSMWFTHLHERDRRVFVALAPMRASFDVAAAAHLAGVGEPEAHAALQRLAASSLLDSDVGRSGLRFRLLEPIRQVAEDLAGRAQELDGLRQRHVEHYAATTVELSAGIRNHDEERAVGVLGEDAAHVRAAWRHAVETNDVDRACMLASSWWWMTLRSLSQRDYSRPYETTQVPGFSESSWRVETLAATAMSEWARSRTLQSIDAGEAAIRLAAELDQAVPFDARFGLIASFSHRGRLEDSHDQMVTLIREAQERHAWYYLSGAQGQIAVAFSFLGHHDEARRQVESALESAERSENTSTLAFARHASALTLAESDAEESLREAYESARLSTRVQNRWVGGWTAATIANLYRRLGRFEEAAIKLDGLIEHWLAAEMEPQFVQAVGEAALLLSEIDDVEGARTALRIANASRASGPSLASDRVALTELRSRLAVPAPDVDEVTLVAELRSRLRAAAGVSIEGASH